MPLQFAVNIARERAVDAALRVVLKTLEPECPAGEHWFVTVTDGRNAAEPEATVFRAYDSRMRIVPPVEGWAYREDAGRIGLKRPVYSKPVPFLPGVAAEQWAAEVAVEVKALLRELCQPGH
jgi:hypothetical protein